VLTDPDFLAALKNTFIFITVSTVAHLVLGLTFAMLLNTPLLSGATKAIFRIVYILPWLFTIAVIAVIWRLMLDPAGVVNYILQHERWFDEYVKNYTNEPVIIDERFEDTEALDGLFSGFDEETGHYEKKE